MKFSDRSHAGRKLAGHLLKYKGSEPLVVGLARGGVAVASALSRVLEGPLNFWIVRKIGLPGLPEVGIGAIAEGGAVVFDPEIANTYSVSQRESMVAAAQGELDQRVAALRGQRQVPTVRDRTVILVDDGIANGWTMRAAIQAIRESRPRTLILAVPIASSQALTPIRKLVDDVVCLHETEDLSAVGVWYRDFSQLSDDEVNAFVVVSESVNTQPKS